MSVPTNLPNIATISLTTNASGNLISNGTAIASGLSYGGVWGMTGQLIPNTGVFVPGTGDTWLGIGLYYVSGMVSGQNYFFANTDTLNIGFCLDGLSCNTETFSGYFSAISPTGVLFNSLLTGQTGTLPISAKIFNSSLGASPSYLGIFTGDAGGLFNIQDNALSTNVQMKGKILVAGVKSDTISTFNGNWITTKNSTNGSCLNIRNLTPAGLGYSDINFLDANNNLQFAIGVKCNNDSNFPYDQPYIESYLGTTSIFYVGAGAIYGGLESGSHDFVWYNTNANSLGALPTSEIFRIHNSAATITLNANATAKVITGSVLNITGAGVGFSGLPNSSAVLDMSQINNKGFCAPRLTKAQRSGISNPLTGLIIYQTDALNSGIRIFDGTNWNKVTTTTDN